MADEQQAAPPPPPGYDSVVANPAYKAPVQGGGSSAPPPPPGYNSVVANPNHQIQPATPTPQPEQEDLFSRTYETSGAKGIVDLGKATFKRPVDLYHEAVDQASKGDAKGATVTALKLLGMLPDANHPLAQAAKSIIMHPIDEMKASYKENRAAGHGKVMSATTIPNVMDGVKDLAAKAKGDLAAGNYAGVVGDVIGAPTESHMTGTVPLVGAAVQQVGGNLDKDLHDHNYSAVAGDILGPLLTMGVGKAIGAAGAAGADGAEAASGVDPVTSTVNKVTQQTSPRTANIAGEQVPVAQTNTRFNPNPTNKVVSVAKNLASEQGAKDFVANEVQPAAVKATQSNLTKSAFKTVDDLRKVRNEPLTDIAPPTVENVSDLTNVLKSAAKPTYNVLDEAAKGDIEEWNAKYGPDSGYEAPKPSKIVGPDGKSVSSGVEPEGPPPKPKTFTDLQDQLGDAQDTLKSTSSSQVDKQWAKENLPIFKQQMTDFLEKHGDKVDATELAHANKAYAQASRYDFISKKLRTASTGIGEGNITEAETPGLKPSSLANIPKTFDNHYGAGEWEKLLGEDGVKNYNDILSALKTPETGGGSFIEFLRHVPGIGKVVASHGLPGVSRIADSLLFNPEAGQTALKLYDIQKTRNAAFNKLASEKARTAVTKAAPAVSAAPVAGGINPDSPESAAQSALSGPPVNPSQGGSQIPPAVSPDAPVTVTPSFTKTSELVKPGNIDLNARPDIKNPDGSHSSVFSMSFDDDNGTLVLPGVGDGKTYPLRKLTPKEALDQYRKTGKNLGTFKSQKAADAYSKTLHEDQAKMKVVNGILKPVK